VVLADNENSNNGYFLRLKKNTGEDALFVDYDQASFHKKSKYKIPLYTEITDSKDESSMKHDVEYIVKFSKTFLRQSPKIKKFFSPAILFNITLQPLIIDIFKQPKNGNKVTFPRTIRPNQYINRLL
jgi:hypothetical protein